MPRPSFIRHSSFFIRHLSFSLLLLLAPLSSPAWNRTLDASPDALATVTSPSGDSRVLLRPPASWSSAYDSNLWTRAILIATAPFADPASPPPPLDLAPLAALFDSATVAWDTAPTALSPSTAAHPALYTNLPTPLARYAFDLAPLLASPASRSNLFAHGASISSTTSAPVSISSTSLLFRAAVSVPPDSTSFAVGYIDTAPRFGDGSPSAVMWEQGEFFVGKVALNGSDASECRAIFSLPEVLASIPPDAIASLVATFDLEVNSTNGSERLLLFPLLPGPALERRRWEDYPDNEPPCPVHGPSWAHADGPVGTNAWPVTPWPVPMQTFTNGVLGEGPWISDYCATATIDHPAKSLYLARFDLIPLWRNPTAREALLSNGAIVLLDPASWAYAFASHASPRLNLYRPPDPSLQAYRPSHTNTHFTVTFAPQTPALSSIAPSATNLSLAATNLDPATDFTLYSSPSLTTPDWTPVVPADFSPLVLPPPAAPGTLFYRLLPLD